MILIIKHIFIEGPGIIDDFFRNTKWQVETIELEEGDKLLDDLRDIEAIITLGGPMNVYEEEKYPFLKDEDRFLKQAIELEIPILGICLGAQLLAKAGGARIRRNGCEEIGWYKINLTEEGMRDCLFEGLGRNLEVFQWHVDQFDVPQKAILLAESKGCRNQAFRLGRNAYGMQFHIEGTPDMVESWIKEYLSYPFNLRRDTTKQKGRGLDSDVQNRTVDTQKILIDTYKKKGQFLRQANKILLNFNERIIYGARSAT